MAIRVLPEVYGSRAVARLYGNQDVSHAPRFHVYWTRNPHPVSRFWRQRFVEDSTTRQQVVMPNG